jgi:hypothetical protein
MAHTLRLDARGYVTSKTSDRPALLGYALIVLLVAIGSRLGAVGAAIERPLGVGIHPGAGTPWC